MLQLEPSSLEDSVLTKAFLVWCAPLGSNSNYELTIDPSHTAYLQGPPRAFYTFAPLGLQFLARTLLQEANAALMRLPRVSYKILSWVGGRTQW